MITTLMYSHIAKELKLLKDTGFEVSCRLSEDDWDFQTYHELKAVYELLEKNPILDLALVDISGSDEVRLCEQIRKKSSSMYLILLTDQTVSPMLYIKPTVMASSLILRPITRDGITSVFTEAVKEIVRSRTDGENGDVFVVDNRDGKRFIPLEQISFFESRNKKIFINTGYEEYSFYDTLDEIEERLGDSFVRCHRSFIVSRGKIKKVMLSGGILLLEGGFEIPLSRSYKSYFKELK